MDSTPTGVEEWEAWLSEAALQPTWDPDKARVRIDKIARRLATSWSIFLAYLILAQGLGRAVFLDVPFTRYYVQLFPKYHLESTEFVAVVTTTTASVFGFLIIVSRALFKDDAKAENAATK